MATTSLPMPPSSLSHVTLRQVYLRGIDLGPAWEGPSADAALQHLLHMSLSRAESLMNIQFRGWRVATLPDTSLQPGIDYDVTGAVLPFVPLEPPATTYRIPLGYHDIFRLVQVRLYTGLSGVPPAPQLTPLVMDTIAFDRLAECVIVPDALVVDPDTVLGWAMDYMVGVGRIPDEVATWVMLHAAMQVLSPAGASEAISHGRQRETLTMDNITESISYAGQGGDSANRGPYAGAINGLERQLDEIDLVKLRFRYQGSHFLVQPGAGLRPLSDPRI